MEKYFIYCRKSTESEDRQALSIESQLNEMKALAANHGIEISEVFTESRTAKEPGRPIFNEMMKRVYRGEVRGILSWKLDRLARNPIDGAAVIWALKQNALKIVTANQTYGQGDDNIILMYIEFGMAHKYVDDLSRNVKRGNKTKLEKGEWIGIAPLGYLNYADPITKEKTLIVDKKLFPILRKMWDKMLTGCYSVEQIKNIANRDWGLLTRKTRKQGGNPVSLSGAYRLFTNSFYCGIMQRSEGTFSHQYEKLVTTGEFDRVQELLGRKDRPRPQKHGFAFTGVMKCAECGCAITAEELTKRIRKDGTTRHYTYYRCTKKRNDLKCSQRYISLAELEANISDFLDQVHIPKSFIQWVQEAMNIFQRKDGDTSQLALQNLEQAHTEKSKALDVLMGMRMRELITDAEFTKERNRLQTEKMDIQKEIQKARERENNLERAVSNIFYFSHQAKIKFKYADIATKKQILEFLGSNWTISGKKLYGDLHKPFLLIEESLSGPQSKTVRLEPIPYATVESPYVNFKAALPTLLALVRDVRNEVIESGHDFTLNFPDFLKFPEEDGSYPPTTKS